jgi:glycosyltransferase involved in cell wall biosynthesis
MATVTPAPAVAVIIPVQEDARISTCVDSILRASPEGCPEIIVVDHRSSPEFQAVLAELPRAVRVLRFDGPTVYGARNLGASAASAPVLLFTDADCVVRRGWVEGALGRIASGADLVQGFSGSVGEGWRDRLIQARYAAHFRPLRPGAPTECDTRNLAVRREVFEAMGGFSGDWRRSGDTFFGLSAEARGFRVQYCPEMRVDHTHDTDLRRFAAKQVCHGWAAQKIIREHPALEWHGGHLWLVAWVCHRWPETRFRIPFLARALTRVALGLAGGLDRVAGRMPRAAGVVSLATVDKMAALAGHLTYEAARPEPTPSGLLGTAPIRD